MSALQKGQKVFVTGATGFLGSHVVEHALKAGLVVRAAARSAEKGKRIEDYFAPKYGKENFEIAVVPDFAVDNAYDEAVKGVDGFIHVASNMAATSDYDETVAPALKGTLVALQAAAKEPSVKRFVLTSSAAACGFPSVSAAQHLDASNWSPVTEEFARQTGNLFVNYAASKKLAEKSAWDFKEKEKPAFDLVTILPYVCFGATHPVSGQESTNAWIKAVQNGTVADLQALTSQWFTNLTDAARVHVKAITTEEVKNERILAWSSVYRWQDIVDEIAKWAPGTQKPLQGTSDEWLSGKDQTTADTKRFRGLLGESTLTNLSDSIGQALGKVPADI